MGTHGMIRIIDKVFGRKINGVRVVPLLLKIVVLFTVFLLLSNFSSNYINLMLNRGMLVKLMNQLLVKDLKESYVFAMNQHDIYFYNQDLPGAVEAVEKNAAKELKGEMSMLLGIKPGGDILFMSSKTPREGRFDDRGALEFLQAAKDGGQPEGSVDFRFRGENYFGVYKYNPKWDVFLVRAEEVKEFFAESRNIFRNIASLIIVITVFCVLVGVFLLRYILRFVGLFTGDIMRMQEGQRIDLLDMDKAPNDDITFLGVAFNSLSSTIDNLLTIFKKFVARDTAQKAYREKEIRLEGTKRDLAILFTDIKSFTFMTETLGTDIIKLLNLHYNQAIRSIHQQNGDVGSIIGDALLAVFGVIEGETENKSLQALRAAYKIQEVASSLRQEMHKRKEEIIRVRGALTDAEERVYRAVLLEVGVGIDGGEVFYGTIGSYERMVNTVIGDNVNSASRLEGLTRIYKVPVIVSDYVRAEIGNGSREYHFLEIDQVQVKGKTRGKKIFWPVRGSLMDEAMEKDMAEFSKGLSFYYDGDWKSAYKRFSACTLPLAEEFRERTGKNKCPKEWDGIWTMTTK